MTKELAAVLKTEVVDPEEFCKKHLTRSSHDLESWGYRAKCIRFLSYVLNVPERTVRSWGKGLEFSQMPDWARRQLSYLDKLAG